MKYALALVFVLLTSFAQAQDCAHNWMLCTTDSPLQIGSFTLHAAEVVGAISASRLAAVRQLKDKRITAAQAQLAQSKADQARALWEQARTACNADSSGNCQGDSARAVALLNQAQDAIK